MSWIELVAQRRPPTAPPGMQPPENAKDWFRIENSVEDEDTTDVFVYDSIGGWFGMYADEFIEALGQVTTSKINLRLNSPGGSVFEGIAIANAIRSHPANVTVYVDSLAASIASVIMMSGDRVVMMPQSQVMIHNASGACYGDATEMTKMADLLDKQSRNIAEAYAQHTGRPVAEWQDYMAAETWFTADEAVAAGLADEAMPMKPKKGECAEEPAAQALASVMNRSWDLSMYNYAGRANAPAPAIPAPQPVAGAVLTREMVQDFMASLPQGQLTMDGVFLDQMRAMVRQTVIDELPEILNGAVGSHSTSVKSGTWDAGANEGRLPSPVPVATVRKMYGWFDSSAVEDGAVPKSACKLPHHFVSADGTPGAASINGVRNALARLPQTQGLSEAERSTVEAHLRAHLNAYGGGDDSEDHTHSDVEAHEHDTHMPKFSVGDRVKITVEPHEEGQDTGVIAEINDGPAYGIRFDDAEHGDEVHHWYAEDEVETASPSNQVSGTEPDHDASAEKTTPQPRDEWAQLVAHLSAPSPSADDVFNSLKEAW